MTALDLAEAWGHEEVHLVRDAAAGLRAVIAVHDTTLGPALGGTRMRLYPSFDDAVTDALRLARAMTYKSAMAEMPYGGGKAVIFGDPGRDKSRALLAAYAKAVDRLDGRFATGCDMGIDLRDVAVMGRLTKHVSHTPTGSTHDTAALAALGVFAGIGAAAQALGREMKSLHVALQGVGQVGLRLARFLAEAGARLTVGDVDPVPRRAGGGRARRHRGGRGPRSTTSRRTSSPPMPAGASSTTTPSPASARRRSSARPTTSSWIRATATRCTRAGSSTARTTW